MNPFPVKENGHFNRHSFAVHPVASRSAYLCSMNPFPVKENGHFNKRMQIEGGGSFLVKEPTDISQSARFGSLPR
jgi:hypothetical protein